MQRSVLCFFHGRADEWEAVCLDFDLAVAGRSFDEAREFLDGAMRLYVEGAMAEDEETRGRLLARSAPWYVRWRFVFRHMISLLRQDRDAGEGGFRMPCPA